MPTPEYDPISLTVHEQEKVKRLTASTRRSLVKFRQRPNPPRGLRVVSGVLSWEAPATSEQVTHYRVYADSDTNLVREIPHGQRFLNDNLVADRVWVSAYNANSDLESVKVKLAGDGAVLNPTDFGARADGVILFDGFINAGSKTFTSAKARFLLSHRGKLIWIQGAGPGGLDLLTTIVAINSHTSVEIADAASTTVANEEFRYGTDSTSAIQAAIDALDLLGGGRIEFPRGVYLTTASLILKSHQSLVGLGWSYDCYNALGQILACCADVPVMQNVDLVTGDGWTGGNIRYLNFRGTSRTGSKGIYSQLSLGTHIEYCAFDHFGDQAIHLDNGIFGIHITGCSATGSCLVRTGRTDYVGVFDIRPSDIFMSRCEVGASTSNDHGGEYGDGFIAAFRIAGTNSFIDHCMGHHSQIGFYIGPTTTPQVTTTLVNCRADQNQGHGWVIDAYHCHLIGCRSHMNYLDAHGTYDAYHVIKGNHTFTACEGTSAGDHTGTGDPHNNLYRDVFHFDVGSFFPPSVLNLCPIGDTFVLNREQVCTRDIYYKAADTRQPIILDYAVYGDPAGTGVYEFKRYNPVNMQTNPIWMEAAAGDADTRQWSIGLSVPGLDNVFNIAAWDDARSAFVFPFAIVRNQTTGAVDYIGFRDVGFVIYDASIVFVQFDTAVLNSKQVYYENVASTSGARRWGWHPQADGQFIGYTASDDGMETKVWCLVTRQPGSPELDFIRLCGDGGYLDLRGDLIMDSGKIIHFQTTTAIILAGSGTPEGVIAAVGGSLYLDGNGAIWGKISGTGLTGWKKMVSSVLGKQGDVTLFFADFVAGDRISLGQLPSAGISATRTFVTGLIVNDTTLTISGTTFTYVDSVGTVTESNTWTDGVLTA